MGTELIYACALTSTIHEKIAIWGKSSYIRCTHNFVTWKLNSPDHVNWSVLCLSELILCWSCSCAIEFSAFVQSYWSLQNARIYMNTKPDNSRTLDLISQKLYSKFYSWWSCVSEHAAEYCFSYFLSQPSCMLLSFPGICYFWMNFPNRSWSSLISSGVLLIRVVCARNTKRPVSLDSSSL